MKHSQLSPLKTSACTSLLRHLVLQNKALALLFYNALSIFKPKPTLLGPLITFVNNFQTLF